MTEFLFLKNLNNILLISKQKKVLIKILMEILIYSNKLLKKSKNNDFIYIGCQILNRSLC